MAVRSFANPKFYARLSRLAANTIFPGATWNGTAGSGGTPPNENPSLRGSGFPHQAIAVFDEPKVTYMTDPATGLTTDWEITVGADHGDTSWIDSVLFWMEGTTSTVSTVTKNARTGSIGFTITAHNAGFAQNGDANLWAYVRPVNGYERRLGPIQITRMPDSGRPVRYIDPAGSDANNGLTSGTPWKSILKASLVAPSGAIVWMADGTFVEDSNSGVINSSARALEFRASSGVQANVVVSRTSRPGNFWQPRCLNAIFNGLTIDMGKIGNFWGPSAAGCYIFKGCNLTDTNGLDGGHDTWAGVTDANALVPGTVQIGYQINTEIFQQPFRAIEGQQNCLLESTITMPNAGSGWRLIRNSRIRISADGCFITNNPGPAVFGVELSQDLATFEQRRHLAHTLTVATVAYAAGTVTDPNGVVVPGKTTLTWNEATTFDTVSAGGQAAQYLRFLSGALANQQFAIYSQNTSGVTVLFGDCRTALAGDATRSYIVWHSDSIQEGGQAETATNNDLIFFQRYYSHGHDLQVLFGGGTYTGQGTITTTGTALSCSTAHRLVFGDFVRLSAGAQKWQYRSVEAVIDAQHATLSAAFTVDQSACTWWHGKTMRAMALQLCIFDNCQDSPSNVLWQWEHGQRHIVVRQITLKDQALAFRTDSSGGFGVDGCLITDSIIDTLGSGSPVGLAPDYGITIDNNHVVRTTTPLITGTNAETGAVTFDASYNPTSGVAKLASQKKIPFNYAGTPLSGASLVGAMG